MYKSASFEEEETDRILAEGSHAILENQPRPMPEILGSGIYPMYDTQGSI